MAANTGEKVSQTQTSDENSFIVVKRTTKRRPTTKGTCRIFSHLRYRKVYISQKGAVFVIVLNTFFVIAAVACWQGVNADNLPVNYVTALEAIPLIAVVLFFPFIGLFSECYFGRYKMLLVSICFLLIAILSTAINAVTTHNSIWYLTTPPLIFARWHFLVTTFAERRLCAT